MQCSAPCSSPISGTRTQPPPPSSWFNINILDWLNNAEDDEGHHLPLQHQEELPAEPHHRGEETGQGLKERPYHRAEPDKYNLAAGKLIFYLYFFC